MLELSSFLKILEVLSFKDRNEKKKCKRATFEILNLTSKPNSKYIILKKIFFETKTNIKMIQFFQSNHYFNQVLEPNTTNHLRV